MGCPCGLPPTCFPTTVLCVSLTCPLLVTCPTHLIYLHLIILSTSNNLWQVSLQITKLFVKTSLLPPLLVVLLPRGSKLFSTAFCSQTLQVMFFP
jgi:hypothetical protein